MFKASTRKGPAWTIFLFISTEISTAGTTWRTALYTSRMGLEWVCDGIGLTGSLICWIFDLFRIACLSRLRGARMMSLSTSDAGPKELKAQLRVGTPHGQASETLRNWSFGLHLHPNSHLVETSNILCLLRFMLSLQEP